MADEPNLQSIPYKSSPGWTWNLMQSPNLGIPAGISSLPDGTYRLHKIVLTLTRIKNAGRPVYEIASKYDTTGTRMAVKGQIKSKNTIFISLTVEGSTSNSVEITAGPTEFSDTANLIVNGAVCYNTITSWVPASTYYTFEFPDKPIIKRTSKLTVSLGKGYEGGNTCGISLGSKGWKNCYWVVEKIEPKPPEPPPQPPKPPTTEVTVWMTDSTSPQSGGIPPGVIRGCIESISFSAKSSDSMDGYSFSGPSGMTVEGVSKTGAIIRTDRPGFIRDYPEYDTATLTINCSHEESYTWTDEEGNEHTDYYTVDTSYDINITVCYYEKIKRERGEETIVVNARDIDDANIYVTNYQYSTDAAKARIAFKGNEKAIAQKQNIGIFNLESNTTIPMSQYFSLASNSSNIVKITEDYESIDYTFRFYNSDVLRPTYDESVATTTYRDDYTVHFTICCAPTMPSQFYYDFLDRDNEVMAWDSIPNIILLNQEDVMVGNLVYTNDATEGGYCRAFKCTFRDYNTKSSYQTLYLDSEDWATGQYTGKILSSYSSLPSNTLIELVIEPYFYFDDSFRTTYTEVAVVIPQLFLKITNEDLLPKLIFPSFDKTNTMMLPNVERFGYEFLNIISDNWDNFKGQVSLDNFKSKFGMNIGGYDLFLEETKYFTSDKIVKRFILDIGSFVADHAMYSTELLVRPFIITLNNTPLAKRYYANEVTIDTSKVSMWRRPIAVQGEYLKYFDYDKFMLFINKYKYLNNNQDYVVPTIMNGECIMTDFWLAKMADLNAIYVKAMYDWVHTNYVSNEMPCWVDTEFTHKKGEYLVVKAHNATHDYLYEMGYTHDYLHNFTHDYIKNMATTNNLKQNYYDLLVAMSAYDSKKEV